MKAFLYWGLWAGANLLAGAAQAALFATAPDASGARISMDCDAQVHECRLRVVGGKVPSGEARTLRFDQPSAYAEFARAAAEKRPGEGVVPDPTVLASVSWTDCREDRETAGLVVLCPVGAWDSGTIVLSLRALCDRCQFAPFVMTTAGAPPVQPREPAEQQVPAPTATQLRTGPTMTAAGQLRTDGVFATDEQSTAEGTRYRSYLRFFDGGVALAVSLVGSPELACRRFVRDTPASLSTKRGRVEYTAAGVVVLVTSSSGVPTRLEGRFDAERLHMEIVVRPGVVVRDDYAFYECPADAR